MTKEELARKLLARSKAAETAAPSGGTSPNEEAARRLIDRQNPTAPQEGPIEDPNASWIEHAFSRISMPRAGAEGPAPMEGPIMAPPPEGPISDVQSALTGFQDSATMGSLGPYRAGRAMFDQTLEHMLPDALKGPLADALIKYGPTGMIREGAGAINALANFDRGTPLWDSAQYDAQVEKELEANPWAAVAGQLGGAIIPGAAEGVGTVKVLEKGGKYGKPFIQKIAKRFANTRFGRILAGTATAAGEGTIYAQNKDEDLIQGGLTGAIGGAAGGAIGEGLGVLARATDASQVITDARVRLGDLARKSSMGDYAGKEGVIAADPRTLMDEDTLMLDANRGVRQALSGSLRNEDNVHDFWEPRTVLEKRQDAELGELAGFESYVKDQLPKGFQRVDGTMNFTGGARAKDTVAANSRNYVQSLQGEYDAILKKDKTTFDPTDVTTTLTQAIRGNNPKPDAGVRQALRTVIGSIKAEVPNDARGMLNLRKAIDNEIDDALSPTASALDKSARRSLVQARNAVNTYLDKVPGLPEVNAKYASSASYQRAYDVGANLLKSNNKTLSPEAMEDYMESLNPGDMQGFYEGLAREIIDSLSSGGGERRTLNKLTKDDNIVKKLYTAFPDTAPQMIDKANKVIARTQTSNEVLAGSRTTLDQAAKNQLHPESKMMDYMVAGLASANIAKAGKGASQAAGLGAIRRLMQGSQSDPDYNQELIRLMLSKGPEQIEKSLGQMRQAEEAFRLPISLAGPDKTLAMQAGDIKRRSGLGGLWDDLTTTDIGGTLPATIGAMPNRVLMNTPAANEQRETRRRARKHQRKSRK